MTVLTQENVRNVVREQVVGCLERKGVRTAEIDGSFDLLGAGVLESVDVAELLMGISQTLGQPLQLEKLDFNRMGTVNELADQIHSMSVVH